MASYPPSPDGLAIDRDGPVVRMTINRPDRRNALTDEIVAALASTIEAAGSDEDCRVIVLGAAGDHFCSGFDLAFRPRPDVKPRVTSTQRRMRVQVNRLIPTMLETQTPIVAIVRGWAVGLGFNLALAADFALVADDARFAMPFTGYGFTPDSGASWLLPRTAGVARAKRVLMLGDEVSGREAAAWGWFYGSVPPDELDAAADALVERLSAAATVSLGLTKALINRAHAADLDRHLADEATAIELSSRSADFGEYRAARAAKRPPDFTGR